MGELLKLDLSQRRNPGALSEFVRAILDFGKRIDVAVSARGWAYLLEGQNVIDKTQFDKAESWINAARKAGLLPVDFVAEEKAREFAGMNRDDADDRWATPNRRSALAYFCDYIRAPLHCARWYRPDWWEGEDYYIQAVVEKIDLKTLFEPVCRRFHVPIANAKGWGSILQRSEYARRFKEHEEGGRQCVLLYCGDMDPDGLRISGTLRANLEQCSNVRWRDGETGYDPSGLIIDRFGLNRDFIEEHGLTWIDNLKTGAPNPPNDLSDPMHRNHGLGYVQDYLRAVGARKCEATAVVTVPESARSLMEQAITRYLGEDAEDRFEARRQRVISEVDGYLNSYGIRLGIEDALEGLGE